MSDPYTMKVCVAGGEPLPCDVDLRGRQCYYDWRVTYTAIEPPQHGGPVDVEVRVVPGVVFVGRAVIHGFDFRYGEGFHVDMVGAGPIKAREPS